MVGYILGLLLLLAACAGPRPGVLLEEDQTLHTIICTEREAPNGERVLFCEFEDRATW